MMQNSFALCERYGEMAQCLYFSSNLLDLIQIQIDLIKILFDLFSHDL